MRSEGRKCAGSLALLRAAISVSSDSGVRSCPWWRVSQARACASASFSMSQAGAEPGDVLLVAPAGTVDAGDAGIRVSGNLIVAARAVANADNVQVQGSSIGLRLSAIDSGTLSAGSGAAAAASQQAAALASRPVDRAATVITVEVQGFGTPDEEQKRRLQR